MPEAQTKATLRQYLLEQKDYLVVRSDSAQYLFLADSLRFYKVTGATMNEYVRLCETGDAAGTFLSEAELTTIKSILTGKDEPEVEAVPADAGLRPVPSPDVHDFLILSLTNECNLACKYCFAETTKLRRTMTFETARKAIDAMIERGRENSEYSIFFFGGEPLTKKALVQQIADYAFEAIERKQNGKVRFLINTNATLIDDEIISLFRKYDFTVTVSLDGPRAYHDTNRTYASGKGSFEKVKENALLLKNNAIKTNIRATFNPDIRDLVDVFAFLESLEIPYSYAFTINSEYKMNLKETLFEEDQFSTVENELRQVADFFYAKIRNGETVYYSGLSQKLSTLEHKMKRRYACEAGRKSMTVDEQGNYFACQNMIPYKKTALGTVDTGISDANRQRYQSKNLETLVACRGCTIRNLCAGGCEVERSNPNVHTMRQMCRLFRMEWQNALYLYALLKETKKN